jgi:hypothetical protein
MTRPTARLPLARKFEEPTSETKLKVVAGGSPHYWTKALSEMIHDHRNTLGEDLSGSDKPAVLNLIDQALGGAAESLQLVHLLLVQHFPEGSSEGSRPLASGRDLETTKGSLLESIVSLSRLLVANQAQAADDSSLPSGKGDDIKDLLLAGKLIPQTVSLGPTFSKGGEASRLKLNTLGAALSQTEYDKVFFAGSWPIGWTIKPGDSRDSLFVLDGAKNHRATIRYKGLYLDNYQLNEEDGTELIIHRRYELVVDTSGTKSSVRIIDGKTKSDLRDLSGKLVFQPKPFPHGDNRKRDEFRREASAWLDREIPEWRNSHTSAFWL